jgi:AAA domain
VSAGPPVPRGVIVELCGLPGAGKTSLAEAVAGVEGAYPLARPALGIAPDVSTGRRLARKVGLVVGEATRRPVMEARVALRLGRSGQPGPGQAASRWVQWASTQALMRQARSIPQVHLFDEGLLQALWSLSLRGDPAPTLAALSRSVGRWTSPDVVIVLDPPVELVVRRLRDRPSAHSRLQRLVDDAELHAELVRGQALFDGLIAWWRATVPAEAPVMRIAGARHDPSAVMHQIVAALRGIDAGRGHLAASRHERATRAGR